MGIQSRGGSHGVRRSIAVAIALIFLLASAVQAAEFWASRKSNKYHYPSCQWAQRIKPQNLIIFNSPEEAIRAGYVPCKVCRPPVSSRTELNNKEKYSFFSMQSSSVVGERSKYQFRLSSGHNLPFTLLKEFPINMNSFISKCSFWKANS